jgi:hypothetical protein
LKGEGEAAIPMFKEAMKIADEINALDVYSRASWSLGIYYELGKKFMDAISYQRAAVNIYKKLNMNEYQKASDHFRQLRKSLGLA